MFNESTILLTGGTGSFGHEFTERIFQRTYGKYTDIPKKLIIFSRDEYKQYKMAKRFKGFPIRYFLGDVRDRDRLLRAFDGVDYVIHAAALKQISKLEYNPTEAIKTNIDGANNIIYAALERGVEKVIALSTDKAVNPINLYGATKLVAEKLFLAANAYGGKKTKFSIVRYGNVIGSRGSVIPFFLELKKQGIKKFPITDKRMTRFWITLEQAVNLSIKALIETTGNQIFVPKIPSMLIVDLAKAILEDVKFEEIGMFKGEKLHETLISEYEGDEYRSDTNTEWLTKDKLKDMIYGIGNYPEQTEQYTLSP